MTVATNLHVLLHQLKHVSMVSTIQK